MSAGRFLLYVVFTLAGFVGLVFVFAIFQSWLEGGLDDGPPEPPPGDYPHVPPETRPR
jgi:hypothetical protein